MKYQKSENVQWNLCRSKTTIDDSNHLEEVDDLGTMTEPILSSQGGDPEAVSVFEFDTLFDIVFEMEGHKMIYSGFSEYSIHLLSDPEN